MRSDPADAMYLVDVGGVVKWVTRGCFDVAIGWGGADLIPFPHSGRAGCVGIPTTLWGSTPPSCWVAPGPISREACFRATFSVAPEGMFLAQCAVVGQGRG